MEFLIDLFTTPHAITTFLFITLTVVFGILFGHLKFGHIKFGIAGVLFFGILFGHIGFPTDESQTTILNFVRDFGLILFVYSIGIETGPRFLSSFRKDGLKLNLIAVGGILMGLLVTILISYNTNIKPDILTGVMCGAVTNTPGLGAATEIIKDQGLPTDMLGAGYAIAYPFGVIGLLLIIVLIRLLFRINIKEEEKSYLESIGTTDSKLESVEITVMNPNIFGKDIAYIKNAVDAELAVSRIYRNGNYLLATGDIKIQEGDVIYGVSEQKVWKTCVSS